LLATVFVALLVPVAAAEAQTWENDVRVRVGWYSPTDLPTEAGPIYGIEIRNLLWERDGFVYGIHLYDETRSEREPFGSTTIDLKAEITLTPFLFGWFHVIPQKHLIVNLGAGIGLYNSNAFSGGVTGTSQVKDVGDFRFLEDETYFGFNVFVGVDLFPDERWGIGAEGRLHIVDNDFGGTELGFSGILRF
jgi:opacity protein-like surface antigen